MEIENGAEFISFEDLLVQADFVIISTAYTEEMAGMFNKKVFNTMKKTAILINISRGRELQIFKKWTFDEFLCDS